MAWSWSNRGSRRGHRGDAWSIEEQPVSKRRRVSDEHQQMGKSEETSDDWGDDSLELTQAELESIDVMASQALSPVKVPSHSTAKEHESFVKPNFPVRSSTNRSSSSSNTSIRPDSNSSISLSSDTSLSSHSSCNGVGQSGKGSSSSSNNNNNNKDNDRLDSLETLRAELEKKEKAIREAHDEKYKHDGEVKYLRESLRKQEMELEKLRAARDATQDQQKQLQTERERSLHLQVESLTSQAQFKNKEYQELQEMVRILQNKLKDADKRSPTPGSQGQSSDETETAKAKSPRKVIVKPSPPSKLKQQQQRDEDRISGSQSQTFPTCASFLEKTNMSSSTKVSSPSKSKGSAAILQIQEPEETRKCPLGQKKTRRLKLNAVCPERLGVEVLRATIQPSMASSKMDPGLPSLLHAMSTSLTLDSLSYTRIKDMTLSPVKSKRRIPPTQGSSVTESGDSTVQVVSRENFQLALQGLDLLLTESRQRKVDSRARYFQNKSSSDTGQHDGNHSECQNSKTHTKSSPTTSALSLAKNIHVPSVSVSSPSSSSSFQNTDKYSITDTTSFLHLLNSEHSQAGAVLLLPMLSDYLCHYVDLIHSAHSKRGAKSANTTPVTSTAPGSSSVESNLLYTSSCSYDSSLDSLSSSVLQLLQDGRVYANAVEKFAISALRCLNILIQLCPVVTSVIVKSSTVPKGLESKITEKPSVKIETSSEQPGPSKQESASDADDEKSTSSSEIRIIRGPASAQTRLSPPSQRNSCQELDDQSAILYLVIGLAGEDIEEGNASPEAVEESLRVLTQLCVNCGEHQLPVLENIIHRGTLSSALNQLKHPQVLLEAQKLCRTLACNSDLMTNLCNKSENCPLYMMYRLSSTPRLDSSNASVLKIYKEYISFLSTMASQHRNGLCTLVTISCPCSEELVVSAILATHKLFALYIKDPTTSAALLHSLLQGILVIHSLAQSDGAFLQHHAPVQPTYVYLLSRMAFAFKPLRSEWEWHVSALEELCDFEPEFNESSQDSEGEERMDVQ